MTATRTRTSMAIDTSPVVDEENPWLGLLAFREANRRFFFGRDEELDDLFRRVRRETLTVLYAQSGLGKTSLLQAGLFPRLREEGFLPVPIRLDYGDFEEGVRTDADPPGRQIAQAIAGAIHSRNLAGATDPLAAPGPWEYLHDVDFDLPNDTGGLLTPVLVFDQLEELFTLGASRRDNGRMAVRTTELLGDLIENRVPRALERAMRDNPAVVDRYTFEQARYRVLLSLREDYLPHLHALRGEIPSIILNNVRLMRFDRRHALDVVERPAAARHLVTRDVADAIVRTVAGQDATSDGVSASRPVDEPPAERLEVDPSLLSLFCRQLNGLRIKRGEAAISLELVASNKESVLRDFYLDSFRDLAIPPEGGVKAFVEDFLLTQKGYRDRLTVERANEILVETYHGAPHDLDTLVDRRLLHVEERGKTPQIELTHDVLAPIALRERTERMHTEELRRAEERRLVESRRAEEDERKAREEAAIAAAQLAKARRQQRVTAFLLGVALVAAALATWFGVNARRAAQRLVVSEKNAKSEAARAIHADSLTKTASAQQRLALDQATLEHGRSVAMLGDFCAYTLAVVNKFGDTTTSNGNRSLQLAFKSLLELSDTSTDQMVQRSPDDLCPLQIDARVSSVMADLLYNLDSTASSIKYGRHGLAAAQRLLPHRDSVSLWVATQSFTELTHAFYFDNDYKDAVLAAGLSLPYARAVDPKTDTLAFDRLARNYHYGANAYFQQRRSAEARQWIKDAVDVVASGLRRKDQASDNLLFTESQLWYDIAEVDSARHDTAASLTDMRRAADAARRRLHTSKYPSSARSWLAKMHGWTAAFALALDRYDESLMSLDSCIENWSALVNVGRSGSDTTWTGQGMRGIGNALAARAHALLGLKRPHEALRAAYAARDTAASLLRAQGTTSDRYLLADMDDSLAVIAHLAGDVTVADSAYADEFTQDSMIAFSQTASWAQIRYYHGSLDHLATAAAHWLTTDTAGKDPAAAAARLLSVATLVRRYREQQVLVSRFFYRQMKLRAQTRADSAHVEANEGDALAIDLGNLAWQELLSGNGHSALGHSREGFQLSPKETYILVNELNSMVLAGLPDEARAFYATNARRKVENPATPFPCAIERDMAELEGRGVATAAQHAFVTQLSASGRNACPK